MQRIHKRTSDYSMPDYYKYFCDKYDIDIPRKKYNKIITEFNLAIRNLIINESMDYLIPHLLFEITIRKVKRKPKIVNGKLINNIPIDWKRTNELWEKDAEAKEKKLLVRYNNSHTSGYIYSIYMKKFKGKIKNKIYYKFLPNRQFKRDLSKRILDPDKDNYDAYLLY